MSWLDGRNAEQEHQDLMRMRDELAKFEAWGHETMAVVDTHLDGLCAGCDTCAPWVFNN